MADKKAGDAASKIEIKDGSGAMGCAIEIKPPAKVRRQNSPILVSDAQDENPQNPGIS